MEFFCKLDAQCKKMLWSTILNALLGAGAIFFFQYVDNYIDNIFDVDITIVRGAGHDGIDHDKIYIVNNSNKFILLGSVYLEIDEDDEQKLSLVPERIKEVITISNNWNINSSKKYLQLKFLENEMPLKIPSKQIEELTVFRSYQHLFYNKDRNIVFYFHDGEDVKKIEQKTNSIINDQFKNEAFLKQIIENDRNISQAYLDKKKLLELKSLSTEEVAFLQKIINTQKIELGNLLKELARNKTNQNDSLKISVKSVLEALEIGFNDNFINYITLNNKENCEIDKLYCKKFKHIKNNLIYIWINYSNIGLLKIKFGVTQLRAQSSLS